MARRRNYNNGYGYKKRNRKRSRKPKYSEIEQFAHKMGKVSRGLNNPNSLITQSFNNGLKPKDNKPRSTIK